MKGGYASEYGENLCPKAYIRYGNTISNLEIIEPTCFVQVLSQQKTFTFSDAIRKNDLNGATLQKWIVI